MLVTSEKLFYCRFGDTLAIPVIMEMANGLRTHKKTLAIDHAFSADGISIWQGMLTPAAHSDRRCRLTMAIVPSDADNIESFFTELEIPPENRILVVGNGSRYPKNAEGLLRIHLTGQAEAHLRDYQRWPVERFERLAAVRLLDVFVLRRAPVYGKLRSEPKPRPRRHRGCYLVKSPVVQAAAG